MDTPVGGYRVSHDRGAVTVGNEAPVWPSPTPGSATTTSSVTSRSDQRDHARLRLVTRSTGSPCCARRSPVPNGVMEHGAVRLRRVAEDDHAVPLGNLDAFAFSAEASQVEYHGVPRGIKDM